MRPRLLPFRNSGERMGPASPQMASYSPPPDQRCDLRSFSASRALTSFFTSASEGGLSTGKRMVPLDVSKSLNSFFNAFIADRLPGNKLQWFENAANPISIPLYLNIGIR